MKIYKFFFHFILIFLFFSSLSLASEWEVDNLSSLAGVVLDAKTGMVLYAKNPHVKIPPASTVKLLTAMILLDRLPLDQKIRISKSAENTPTVPPFLREGEVYTMEDLLNLMLIKSSNQAAVALAEAVSQTEENFSYLMNTKAHSLGLRNSKFRTASGLPASDQYTTAYDLALLLYEALKYPKIAEIINTPVKVITNDHGKTIIIKNTNHLLFDDDYKEMVIGGKTGYTKLSKHCLVNVSKAKDRMVITSLLGAPNREALWQDTKRMLKMAELVLENKLEPVYVNTVVHLTEPVNHVYSIKKYYKTKKGNRLAEAKILAKASRSVKKGTLAKEKHKATSSNQRVAKAQKNKPNHPMYSKRKLIRTATFFHKRTS